MAGGVRVFALDRSTVLTSELSLYEPNYTLPYTGRGGLQAAGRVPVRIISAAAVGKTPSRDPSSRRQAIIGDGESYEIQQ